MLGISSNNIGKYFNLFTITNVTLVTISEFNIILCILNVELFKHSDTYLNISIQL